MASTGAQGAAAGILNPDQVTEIERVILLTIGEASQRASQELKTAQEAIVESGQQLYAKTMEFGTVQDDIKNKMEEFNAERMKMVDEMKGQHADFAKVREEIAGYVAQKDQLVLEVTSKCKEHRTGQLYAGDQGDDGPEHGLGSRGERRTARRDECEF